MTLQKRHLGIVLGLGLLTGGAAGCSSGDGSGSGSSAGSGGSTSGSAGASGGATSTAASSSSAVSSGGKENLGGSKTSGGVQGGSSSNKAGASGGTTKTEATSSGGTSAGGTTNATSSPLGGSTASTSDKGGASGGTTTGGTVAGGAGSGGKNSGGAVGGNTSATSGPGGSTGTSGNCTKGQVKAKELIFMGESFYAINPQYIQKRIEANARKAGSLGANESYRNVAISGQPLSVIVGEFDTALQGGAVKVVIMDGGGIDCMSSPCDGCPNLFKNLLTKMASNGVQDVIYTRYPEPGNPPGSDARLKGNLDILMPKMQPICEGATGLKCHWVDLRPVWVNGDTQDGLHPTQSGGDHVGDLIWAEMVKDCIAQ